MRCDSESIRTALRLDLLSQAFNDRLLTAWTDSGHPTGVEYPVEVYRTVKWAPSVFPCGEIGLNRAHTNDVEAQNVDLTWDLTVYWHVIGTIEEEIEDQVSRLVGATRDLYSIKVGLEPYLMGVSIWAGDEDYSPFMPVQQDVVTPLLKTGAIQLYVRGRR